MTLPLPQAPPDHEWLESLGGGERVRVLKCRYRGQPAVCRIDAGSTGRESRAELAVLGSVRHPNLARLLAHGALEDGQPFVTRAWVEGETLDRWAAERGDEETGLVCVKLSRALHALHAAGFLHGDLKATNVIVQDDEPTLCDFGLSSASRDTRAEVSGTLFAIAPEILLGQRPNARSDLFALGVLLHALWTKHRASARDFYGRFPGVDYFEATETRVEELPAWARDLVASLVSRDPEQRPLSALAVANTLAARLGAPTEAGDPEQLTWPAGWQRETWVESLEQGSRSLPQWLQVPKHEDPSAFAEFFHLRAGLDGSPWTFVDLAHELPRHENPAALQAWLRRTATEPALIVVHPEPGSPQAHAAVRALRQGARRLLVVSVGPPTGDGAETLWETRSLDPVTLEQVESFLRTKLEEPEERLQQAARTLHAAGRGSATLLARALQRACREGWYLVVEGHARLRPGPLPERLQAGGNTGDDPRLRGLSRPAKAVLAAAGFLNSPGDLAAVVDLDEETFASAVGELREHGLLSIVRSPDGETLFDVESDFDPADLRATFAADDQAALHARRAAQLEARDAPRAHTLVHAWCATPGESTADALARECARLRDSGAAEWALRALDAAEAYAGYLGHELPGALLTERALAWCALGETERATQALADMSSRDTRRDRALRARVRAAIAMRKQDFDGAERELRESIRLDPANAVDALVARANALFYSGRDAEFLELAGSLPEDFARSRRQHDQVRSLEALVHLRAGDSERATSMLGELVASASEAGDEAAEAALRISLATVLRRTGDLEAARRELERAVHIYREAGLMAGLAQALSALAGTLRELGELPAAEPLLQEAVEMREALGDRPGALLSRGMLGLHFFERGHAQAAMTELMATADSIQGTARSQYVPVLEARADEMLARVGAGSAYAPESHNDPRVDLARARGAWMRGDPERAATLAASGLNLARAMGRKLECAEGELLLWALADRAGERPGAEGSGSLTDDLALLDALEADDGDALEALARRFEHSGRDDRAARARLGLARMGVHAKKNTERARESFARCARGLTEHEAAALGRHLIGIPDPRPTDLAHLQATRGGDEEFEMDVLKLLEINHRLVDQQDLKTLVGAIVENALAVTGGERGFLMLEEDGEMRFDTALDSIRGPIQAPELEISRSIVSEALEQMTPQRVSNAVDDPLLGMAPSVVSLDLRSVLCVPFRVSEGLRGALYVDHRVRRGAFSERSVRLLSLLADQASLAILQVIRIQEIRELNRQLNRKVVQRESDLITAQRALREAGRVAPLGGLVGSSTAMREVHQLLERAAATAIPVMVTGDSGTGKELAARAIHDLSARQSGPFVTENCAAIPESLIEAELFGHVRGAFTGAESDRPGMFERAHGGTLFLDEIGEMPVELQAKLLRVLETSELRRVGDSATRKVDFRLVVATNRDLEACVEAGTFRADLFYRLDGFRISMPAISERTEDIPALVDHFLRLHEAEDGLRREVTNAVLTRLCRRAWPGNVRELSNEVARLCVLSSGDLDDPELVRVPGQSRGPGTSDGAVRTMAELERQAILDALRQTGGDKRAAAGLLGISRAKIYQRLKEWKLTEFSAS